LSVISKALLARSQHSLNILATSRVSLHSLTSVKETTLTNRFGKLLYKPALIAALTISLGLCIPNPTHAQAQNDQNSSSNQSAKDKDNGNISAGFNLGQDASAKDVGLPIYPGARRHADTKDDSSALNMGLWGGSTGFKMALLKLETNDSPEKVAAFYRKALAKYGKVLTCGTGDAAAENSQDKDKSSQTLNCDSDKPDKGGIELKAGTKEKQHIVGISQEGSATTFQLVYVETRGLDNK
jgi:hypothetical protein